MDKKIFQKAFTATIPVISGYVVLGTAFGFLIRTAGLPAWTGPAMSMFVFAGSLQFALIPMLTGSASLFTVLLTSLVVNARHLFYGISMLEKYKGAGPRKPYLIFGLTDETYSLVCSVPSDIPETQRLSYCFLVTVLDHFYWVFGSLLGVTLGSVLHFNTDGMDFALTALFITVVTGQWLDNKDRRPVLAGFICSLAALLLFGPSSFLIPAMVLIAAALLLFYAADRKKEARHDR
ncbi:MAG: AzlC family ABC transporter permease [Firmicutes bacterium]|nr:AzlC family ABC transporter permease [Bacillota bacterium]